MSLAMAGVALGQNIAGMGDKRKERARNRTLDEQRRDEALKQLEIQAAQQAWNEVFGAGQLRQGDRRLDIEQTSQAGNFVREGSPGAASLMLQLPRSYNDIRTFGAAETPAPDGAEEAPAAAGAPASSPSAPSRAPFSYGPNTAQALNEATERLDASLRGQNATADLNAASALESRTRAAKNVGGFATENYSPATREAIKGQTGIEAPAGDKTSTGYRERSAGIGAANAQANQANASATNLRTNAAVTQADSSTRNFGEATRSTVRDNTGVNLPAPDAGAKPAQSPSIAGQFTEPRFNLLMLRERADAAKKKLQAMNELLNEVQRRGLPTEQMRFWLKKSDGSPDARTLQVLDANAREMGYRDFASMREDSQRLIREFNEAQNARLKYDPDEGM